MGTTLDHTRVDDNLLVYAYIVYIYTTSGVNKKKGDIQGVALFSPPTHDAPSVRNSTTTIDPRCDRKAMNRCIFDVRKTPTYSPLATRAHPSKETVRGTDAGCTSNCSVERCKRGMSILLATTTIYLLGVLPVLYKGEHEENEPGSPAISLVLAATTSVVILYVVTGIGKWLLDAVAPTGS